VDKSNFKKPFSWWAPGLKSYANSMDKNTDEVRASPATLLLTQPAIILYIQYSWKY